MHRLFLALFLFIQVTLFAEDPKPLICLNMIVKNETPVIRRCLASVKPIIDYWVIVDTGSTDGTQEMIKEFMKDVPGDLHERPWKNFEHNRNEALDLAKGKGDYILIIDADEVLEFDPDFKLPKLDRDFYHMMTKFGGTKYARVQLVNNHLDWKWKGVLHEAIDSPHAKSSAMLTGVYNVVRTDGARSQDPNKYQKDVAILEEALKAEPNNTRYVFYLAQSYKDANDYKNALETYQKRATMGGWDEEIYMCHYQSGLLRDWLNYPKDEVIASHYKSFQARPTRAEPLLRLADYYRRHGQFLEGYVVSKAALGIPLPNDLLFMEKWAYDYGILLECSINAYWIGKFKECYDLTMQLLAVKDLPENVKDCAERNLVFAKEKLGMK
jgi:glycosyltransferase involved in cell wall biosynthesis